MKLKKIGSIMTIIMISTTFIGGIISSNNYISYGMENELHLSPKAPQLITPSAFEKYTKIIIDKSQDVEGAQINFLALDTWNIIKKIGNKWKEVEKVGNDFKEVNDKNRSIGRSTLVKVINHEDHVEFLFDYIADTPEKEKNKKLYIDSIYVVTYVDANGNKSEINRKSFVNTKNNIVTLKGVRIEVNNRHSLSDIEVEKIKEELIKINKDNDIKTIEIKRDLTKKDAIIVRFSDDSFEINPNVILDDIVERQISDDSKIKTNVNNEVLDENISLNKEVGNGNKYIHSKEKGLKVEKSYSKNLYSRGVSNIYNKNIIENTLQGINPIELSINASKFIYNNGSNSVVLVNKSKLSDVLTVIPFATKNSSPILYTDGKDLDKGIVDEIQRLGAKKIFLIGGEKSISRELYIRLNKSGYLVKRIGGRDRYETNKLINLNYNTNFREVSLVSGEKFPDSLSISPYVLRYNMPILLVNKNNIPKDTEEILKRESYHKITLFGGEESISNDLYLKLLSRWIDVKRVAGKDRYDTSRIVSNKMGYEKGVVLSDGKNLEKTLIASMISAKKDIPLVLVNNINSTNEIDKLVKIRKIVVK